MKVVFGGNIARKPVLEVLRAFSGIDLVEVDAVAEAASHVAGADVLVIANPRGKQGEPLVQALQRPTSTVRWIQVVSAGTDGLTSYGLPAHIRLTNQGGASAPVVAEHAMALLLALCRRIDLVSADTARGAWQAEKRRPLMRSMEGATIGVVGLGNIGAEFAQRARAFGATIVGFSRSGEPRAQAQRMYRLSDLRTVVPELDAMVICIALAQQTRHLIDANLLAACKPSCLVVNVGRGEVVAQGALEAALREGRIAGAALDVTDPDPLPADAALWTAPNLIVSPHVGAGGSDRTGRRIAALVGENLRRFLDGQAPLHEVAR